MPLTFAFEANNALGSAGASLFTLNWKVPAAKVQTTQILAGGTLTSASDGHPAGYQWSFGPDAQNLTASCTTASCAPPAPYNTKGTYAYSLTAKYFVDQAFTTTTPPSTYTVTDFAPAFTVNGSATGPITGVINQSLNVVNSSQHGAGISATYQYNLCLLALRRGQLPDLVRDGRPAVVRLASHVGDDSDSGDRGELRPQAQGELHGRACVLAGSGRRHLLSSDRGGRDPARRDRLRESSRARRSARA